MCAALAAVFVFAGRASADSVAMSVETVINGGVTYDSSTGLLSGTNIPVTASSFIAGINDPNAVFSFKAHLDTTGAQVVFGSTLIDDVTNVQFSITDGATNLLTGGSALGDIYGSSAGLQLVAQNATFNQGVNFNSDVLNTSTNLPESLQINVTDAYDNGSPVSVSNGNFTSFTADLAPSSFGVDIVAAPLPSAAMGGCALLGLLGLGTVLLRKPAAQYRAN